MNRQQWRTEKVRRPRAVVEPYVNRIIAELSGANPGLGYHVAGSWRRGADPVGDIDVIVVNESGALSADLLRPGVHLPTSVVWQRRGDKIANGSVPCEDGLEIHVDLWACRPCERGAFLIFSTGPAKLNMVQRQHAKRRGLALSQVGLLDRATKQQLDDGTERDVYRLLGLPFLTPEERQRWAEPVTGVQVPPRTRIRRMTTTDGSTQ